jgi:hypothetical protein
MLEETEEEEQEEARQTLLGNYHPYPHPPPPPPVMQCCGFVLFLHWSVPLTNGSGSCSFRQWPSRRQQKTNFFTAYYFLKVKSHHFSKIKSHNKKSQKSRNQSFSYYFCLMIEGSGSGPLTNGSGSRRPENIRIRIRNTAGMCSIYLSFDIYNKLDKARMQSLWLIGSKIAWQNILHIRGGSGSVMCLWI